MGNFFFPGVFGAELAPFDPLAPWLTPLAFLHLEVSNVTGDVGKKEWDEDDPPIGFYKRRF